MQEMTLYGVSFEPIGKQPIVLLKTADDDRFLPIWIGHPEAAAILTKLQGATPPRPMTHDLLSDIITELQGEIVRVEVRGVLEGTAARFAAERLESPTEVRELHEIVSQLDEIVHERCVGARQAAG